MIKSKTFFFLLNNCLDIDDNDIITQRFLFLIQNLLNDNNRIILVSYKNIFTNNFNLEFRRYINSNQLKIEYTHGLKLILKKHELTFQNVFSFNLLKIIKKYLNIIDLFILDDIPYRNYLVNYITLLNKKCLVNSLINFNSYINFYQYDFLKGVAKNHYNFIRKDIVNISTSESFLKSISLNGKYITWPKLILKDKINLNIDQDTKIIQQRNEWNHYLNYEYHKFLLCITELTDESNIDKVIDILPNDVALILVLTNPTNKYDQNLKLTIETKNNILMNNINDISEHQLAIIYKSSDFMISANSLLLYDIYILLGYFYHIPCIIQCNDFSSDFIVNNSNGIFININQDKQVQTERINFAFERKKRLRNISKIFDEYFESNKNFYQNFNNQILNKCLNTQYNYSNLEGIKLLFNYFIYIFYILILNFKILYINKFGKYQINQIYFDSNISKKYKIINTYIVNLDYLFFSWIIFYFIFKNCIF